MSIEIGRKIGGGPVRGHPDEEVVVLSVVRSRPRMFTSFGLTGLRESVANRIQDRSRRQGLPRREGANQSVIVPVYFSHTALLSGPCPHWTWRNLPVSCSNMIMPVRV